MYTGNHRQRGDYDGLGGGKDGEERHEYSPVESGKADSDYLWLPTALNISAGQSDESTAGIWPGTAI